MLVGILFTVLVSLAIATFSILAFFDFKRINARFYHTGAVSFALFWFCMSFVWFFTALSDFFGYLNMRPVSIIMTYALQIFVGGSLLFAFSFLAQQLLGHAVRFWLRAGHVGLYAIFLWSLFWFGLNPRGENFFANQITTSNTTLTVFLIMFFPLWVMSVWLFVSAIRKRRTLEKPVFRFLVIASLSFIILGAAGSVDEVGIVYGWAVTASRLISLTAAISAYFAMGALTEPDELVI